MIRRVTAATVLWAFLAGIGALIVARARFTTDLSAFLPQHPTATQRLLVDQLRAGLASRLIIVAIAGGDPQQRAGASTAVAATLRTDPQFLSVSNGDPAAQERDRQYLFEHRYLLSDAVTAEHFTVPGLRQAIQDTLDLLASPAGLLVKALLARDPTGEMVHIVETFSGGSQPRTLNGVWVSHDGRQALLLAQTRAAGSDTDAQERATVAIRHAFSQAGQTTAAGTLRLQMSGPGVFSVAARANIKHEVVRLSLISTALIGALLLGVYRSVPALILGLVPVASGALAGVAAVALGFGVVHGITLGFGVTLIGEAVDYSIYLFIQSRVPGATGSVGGSVSSRPLWPTITLGVLTSVCGFAALLPSGFPGVAQLGLYSISGLIAAALVTRFVLPGWLPRKFAVRDLTPLGLRVAAALQAMPRAAVAAVVLIVPAAAALILLLHRGPIWNTELAALSPVPAADQQLDAQLRGELGAPDVRYLVVVSGADAETVLRAAERLEATLQQLVDDRALGGFESPARYLPSRATQRARQAALPPSPQLQERLQVALKELPIRAERLSPFVQDVEATRSGGLLDRKELAGTAWAAALDSMLIESGQGWTALLPLRATPAATTAASDIDVAKISAAIAKASASEPGADVQVLDLKREADALYADYLSQIVRLALIGFAAIALLLLLVLRSLPRLLRVLVPLVLAVVVVAAALVLSGHTLTILHVIGMLLIVAVGSNYALFFDRRASDRLAEAVPLTLASLLVANAATVLGFGVLASSSVPVLTALGSTVAPGALLALLFSALLAGTLPLPAQRPSN
jgi:predicted exporter